MEVNKDIEVIDQVEFFKNYLSLLEAEGYTPETFRNGKELEHFMYSKEAEDFLLTVVQREYKPSFNVDVPDLGVVNISVNDPFDACLPKVWKSLNFMQKLNTLKIFFDYFCNRENLFKEKKPTFRFSLSEEGIAFLGYTKSKNKLRQECNICLRNLYESTPLDLTEIIPHELCHAKQQSAIIKNYYDSGNSLDYLNEYYKNLITPGSEEFRKILKNLDCEAEIFIKFKDKLNLSYEEFCEFKKLLKSKNRKLERILKTMYQNHPLEEAAFNKGDSMKEKVYRYLKEKYPLEQLPKYISNAETFRKKQKKAGFDFSKEDLSKLGKINIMISCTNSGIVMLNCIKFILDTYKNNKVPEKFPEGYTEAFANAKNQFEKILNSRTFE